MKILFWNLRGFGNPETRLALKNYCLSHKPDVVFLAEPMIAFDQHNSDHHPLLVSQDLSGVKHPAPFRFFRAWTSHADCVRVVKEVWAEPVHGSPMVCLQAKLKRLKAALKEWNLTVFGNMDHNVTSAIDEVHSVQALIDEIGITDALQQRDFEAQLALSKVLLQQEIFWREKARVNNFSFGDRNTAYFHSANSLIQDCIPDLVSTEDNNFLTSTPSDAEIKSAIFSMNGDGAPGPDGFGGHFYQHFWDIVASDEILHSARLSILVNGKLAVMCRARFLKWGQPSNTFLKSSLWHGIKHHVHTVKANTRWIIGSGTEISFWLDNWLSEPLVDVLNLPISAYPSLTARVSSFIVNGEWNIPTSIVQRDSEIRARIDNVVIPRHALEDMLIWCPSKDGTLSAKQAYDFLYTAQPQVDWTEWI
ncbi:hypothetical protein QL285_082369 [Trifolium repens]|nr:hypothetical protein QL285_082369 [Trifolium repens]